MQYSIVGHSGEGFKFDFVKVNNPPKNNKERLMVMEVRRQGQGVDTGTGRD